MSQRLKVTFENGKTIIDGIPALLYINSDGRGVGQLYKNGKRLTHLQKVNIQAEQTEKICPVICEVRFAVRQEQEVTMNAENNSIGI